MPYDGPKGYPYRHRGTEGLAAGQTFVYYSDTSLITYDTEGDRKWYFMHHRDHIGELWHSPPSRYPLTPMWLERFESVPEWTP